MGFIEIKGLCKTYGRTEKKVEVLKGLDLFIERGETVAVVGASGVGKSTLLNIMGALDRPTRGEVLYAGESIFSLDERELARFRNSSVGFVFQFHHLLPEFTAMENVMLPALISGTGRDEAADKARRLLSEVGLSERLHHKPGELSGGEAQRTALVRALIRSPGVVLADEPTGNLDAASGEEVLELILRLNEQTGATMVIVTHNEKIARSMERRLEMVDGRIVEGHGNAGEV